MTKIKRKQQSQPPDYSKLREEYDSIMPLVERFSGGLSQQLRQIVDQHSLTLAIPVESRIKTWPSLVDKIERGSLKLTSIRQMQDIVGLRLVFLFSRDLQTATKAITDIFTIISQEDTADRLGDTKFGYHSLHYIIHIPTQWSSVPIFAGCKSLQAEVQLRTIAQHTWAAASHKLQYKKESSVPPRVRRSIYRVSALLETVDLEFERVLNERELYLAEIAKKETTDEKLNVDLLTAVLNEKLPSKNREDFEDYDDLLTDLKKAEIFTVRDLNRLINKYIKPALKHDSEILSGEHPEYDHPEPERAKRGVFLTHAGLIRQMIEFSLLK